MQTLEKSAKQKQIKIAVLTLLMLWKKPC